jgi:[protein-PII] uridylyltransferase
MSLASTRLPQAAFDRERFDAELAAGRLVAAGKHALSHFKAWSHQRFAAGDPVRRLIYARARFIDTLLAALWEQQDWPDSALALVAVGGYGRGELHPHSDIDLLILTGEDGEQYEKGLERFLTSLWDLGLTIGHSVRTVKQCAANARKDITVLTNMMEARLVSGDAKLLEAMQAAISTDHMWPSRDFFAAKIAEQQARHTKFADTEYNLEPNVKSSPGGLRDLQVITWIAERHFGKLSLQQMSREQFLTREESRILVRGRDFMWRVRYALHMITDREEDRLLFDHQRQLAALWDFRDGDKLAVEQFMQLYYRWALALGQLNELLIQNFDQAILRQDKPDQIRILNERFQVRNGYIEARSPDLFETHPPALLEVFVLSGQDSSINGVSAPTVRLIRDNRHRVDAAFRANPVNQALFLDILRSPHKMTAQLRRMNRYGILGEYLPEFGQIVGQMQHDLFHTYTVDAHTLEVVKNMRRFMIPDFDDRFPVTSRVARRLDRKELLYVAGLYHDIGKGRGGDHSELGAVDAEHFCRTHGFSQRDTNLVVWLVRYHLVMSGVAQRKDISDPQVIQEFARLVGDQRRLDYLLALTVADIHGTNPTLWNAWRGSLLRQLYTETKRALRRGLENPVDKHVWIGETQKAVIDILEYRGFDQDEVEELWRDTSEDYFLREKAEDIAWHLESIARHYDKDRPLVLVRSAVDSSVANATQIFIHARSRPHLFSAICAELEQLDLSVHDARIYGSSDGMSLDTFFVLGADGESIAHDMARINYIADHLTRALADVEHYPDLVSRRTPRQMKCFSIPTVTSMSLDPIKNQTVLEVATPDRPGLLARIGRIFVKFDIVLQAAKIQTLGERVEDVFFITDRRQQPLTDAALCEDIQRAICRELDEQAAA